MATTVKLTYNPVTDRIYVDPPLAVATENDRGINFILDGGGVLDWRKDNSNDDHTPPITFITTPGPGYSDAPAEVAWQKLEDGSWLVTFPNPPAHARVYYKWKYHLVNSATGKTYEDDPDIGNDPPSGGG